MKTVKIIFYFILLSFFFQITKESAESFKKDVLELIFTQIKQKLGLTQDFQVENFKNNEFTNFDGPKPVQIFYQENKATQKNVNGIESITIKLTDSPIPAKQTVYAEIHIQYLEVLPEITKNHLKTRIEKFAAKYNQISISFESINKYLLEIFEKLFGEKQDKILKQLIQFKIGSKEVSQNKIQYTILTSEEKFDSFDLTVELKELQPGDKTIEIQSRSSYFTINYSINVFSENFVIQVIERILNQVQIKVYTVLIYLNIDASNKTLEIPKLKEFINSDPEAVFNLMQPPNSTIKYSVDFDIIFSHLKIIFNFENTTKYLPENLPENQKKTQKIQIVKLFPLQSLYDPYIFPLLYLDYILYIIRYLNRPIFELEGPYYLKNLVNKLNPYLPEIVGDKLAVDDKVELRFLPWDIPPEDTINWGNLFQLLLLRPPNRAYLAKGQFTPKNEQKIIPQIIPERQPIQEIPKNEPIQEIPKIEPIQEIPKIEPIQEITKNEPIQEIPKIEPIQEIPKIEPIKEIPKIEPVQDIPKYTPTYDTPKYTPTYDTPKYTPTYDTPKYTPTYDTPKYTPTYDTPKYTPTYDTPKYTPTYDTPKYTPTYDTPKYTPTYDTPKYTTPSYDTYKYTPSYTTPKYTTPSYDTYKYTPSYTTPEKKNTQDNFWDTPKTKTPSYDSTTSYSTKKFNYNDSKPSQTPEVYNYTPSYSTSNSTSKPKKDFKYVSPYGQKVIKDYLTTNEVKNYYSSGKQMMQSNDYVFGKGKGKYI